MEKLKVFIYGDDHGGFGDFIKSLKMYINYSLKNNNKICIYITNNSIKDFITIKDKYKYKSKSLFIEFMKTPDIVRNKTMNINCEKCDISLFDYIDFRDVIYKRFEFLMKHKNIKSYNCIHIRKGDKYGNKSFPGKGDDRCKNKDIYSIIEKIIKSNNNSNIPLILVSDNFDIKKDIANKYKVIIFDIKILHLDSQYTKNINHKQIDLIDNLTEYLILCKANTIHSIGKSGFSYTASWFYKNKILFY